MHKIDKDKRNLVLHTGLIADTTKGEKMKNSTVLTKESSAAISNANTDLSKAGIKVIGFASVLIGCWAVASLVAGAIANGGPVALLKNLFQAILG